MAHETAGLPGFDSAQVPHLRAAAFDGICPICGHGPWPSLGIHSARRHAVPARDLKAALGIPARASLSSRSVRVRARQVGLDHPERTAVLTEAGRTSRRNANIGAAGAQGKRWGLRKAQVRSADIRRKLPEAEVSAAAARIDQGETYAEVAADFDLTASGLWYRVKQWRDREKVARRRPGPSPKPITLNQVVAAIAEHGSQVAAAKALGVSRNLVRARLSEMGRIKHPNAARDKRVKSVAHS